MAENRIYIASLASVIAVTGAGIAVPLGLVMNLRLEKRFTIEAVAEWGNFLAADLLIHAASATFSWSRAYNAGIDLISQGLIPSDAEIAQFVPIFLRIIDKQSSRQIAMIHRGLAETYSIGADARSKLNQDVAGQAVSLLFESELN
jgi:hypothetical protein